MKPYFLAILFIVLVSLIVIPVSAETLTGTLGSNEISSRNYYQPVWVGPDNAQMRLYSRDIENTAKAFSVVRFMNTTLDQFAVGAPPTAYVPCTFSIGGTQIGTGTIGYQRTYNSAVPPVETPQGFEYVIFNSDWNITGRTGNILVTINYNDTLLYNCRPSQLGNPTAMPSSWLGLGGTQAGVTTTFYAAPMTWNQDVTLFSSYTATQPSGLGIQGTVSKTVGGTNYPSRIFVVDGTTGATITADSTTNGNDYNFTVLSRQSGIKICMYNAATTTWSNSSTLFAGATPTPTNSPTPGPTTPEPGSWTNITFTTKYGVNSTVIPNVFTKLYMYHEGGPMGDDDWSQAVDGYTDSNGQITFGLVDLDGWDFRVEFTKPGLYQLDFWVTPSQYTYSLPVYMYVQPPNSEIPGFPTTINLTVQVKNANTFAAISGAWVTVGDEISGTNYVGQSTNATGYVVFPGIPNTANINGVISKVGFVPLTYWVTSGALLEGDTAITKYLYLSTSTATPTITPVPQEGVTLTANPNSVAPGQSTTLTTTCANVTACTGAGGMSVVTYSEKYPDPSWDTHLIRAYKWNATRGYYDWKNSPSDPWTATGTYTGLTATGTPTISGTNTYYVNIMRTDYYSIGTANVGVLVTGAVSGNLIMKLAAQDQTTGGHLSNYQMNLTNMNTLAITEYGTIPYDKDVLLPRGQDYRVQCSKTGYLNGQEDFTVPTNPDIVNGDMGTFVNCPLYPTGSISAGNTTVTVKVFDSENYVPLSGVTVQMSAPLIYSDSPKYTGGDGSGVFFIIGYNQTYSVTASKTGYCAVTETGTTGTLDTKNVYLNLKYGSCLGPTPTHTPTPGPTGTGTVIVTPTTFQPGNATSFWTPWINVFTMMGARSGEINMLLAGLIIVLCMAAGAGMAGVLGAEVLMGFGAIFCVAIGLIPIWVVLAIIILGFLFYGLKIGR